MRDKTTKLLLYPAKWNKKILFILFYRLKDRYENKCCRKCERYDDRTVYTFGIYQNNVA